MVQGYRRGVLRHGLRRFGHRNEHLVALCKRCAYRAGRTRWAVSVFVGFSAASAALTSLISPVSAEVGAEGRGERPIVIAHRGASAYLPEHTLPAKALAHAQGADFIEQDVVLTRDGIPIVLHDVHLDSTTDVASRFSGRERGDGRFYAIDFTLAEVQQLRAHERLNRDGRPVFPERFPAGPGLSQVPTLEEEIQLIDGLNRSTGRVAGLYIELKGFAFHAENGLDLAEAVINVLRDNQWDKRSDDVYIQSFEPAALRYLHDDLKTDLPLIQLLADSDDPDQTGDIDFGRLRTVEGLREIATYANGIGPSLNQLYQGKRGEVPVLTDLVARAHKARLLVHPYTLRADQLPDGISDFDELHRVLVDSLDVDGFFTDFPDRSATFLQSQSQSLGQSQSHE